MRQHGHSYRADVVIPCFNEEDVLPRSVPRILARYAELVADPSNTLSGFRLLLVDDGSSDSTWSIIEDFARTHPEVQGVALSRNFGHQAAMLAGLSEANADVAMTMDADLQDDILAVGGMISAYEAGADLALGVRIDRGSDSVHKRTAAGAYYRLLAMMGVNVVPNHADFRLMSQRALQALLQHQEVNLFLRGLIPTLGFTVTLVPYVRQPRDAGQSKYTLRKMLHLAIDGITSFSIVPLRIIALAGFLIFLGTAALGTIFLWVWFTNASHLVPGWASTVLPILFLGGVQLLSIGIVGEYVGKIYLETKRRPRFLVQARTTPLQDAKQDAVRLADRVP
jgi:glycosyltransferase involved in cell wall biosynthesis